MNVHLKGEREKGPEVTGEGKEKGGSEQRWKSKGGGTYVRTYLRVLLVIRPVQNHFPRCLKARHVVHVPTGVFVAVHAFLQPNDLCNKT